jgi:hypothetical protein
MPKRSNTVIQSPPELGHNPYNTYGRTHNALARAFLADNPTPENKSLLADLERLENDLSDTRKWADIPNEKRSDLRDQMLHEVQLAHWQRCAERKEKLSAEFEAFRASWQRQNKRDGSERLADMQRYRTEIKLDDSNLEATLLEAASAETPEERAKYDPDYLYALAEHAADKGLKGALGVAKSALENCNVKAPWLNDPRGDALAKEMSAVDAEYGTAKIADDFQFDIAEAIK